MSQLHSALRYRGPLVSVCDVRCRPSSACAHGEEQSTANEVVFVRAGVFVRQIGHDSAVADPNHVLFFNRGEPYRVTHPAPGGDDCTSFVFASDLLREALSLYEPRTEEERVKPFRLTRALVGARTILRQQRLRQLLNNPSTCPLEIEESALHLLEATIRDAYRHRPQPLRRHRADTLRLRAQWIESVKLLIARHVSVNVSLDEIARAVHCSPFHLARIFRASIGSSIHQYQLRLRLALSLERVAEWPRNLTEVALDLGFASHSHFTTAFQRAFGMAPSAFRRGVSGARLREVRKILEV